MNDFQTEVLARLVRIETKLDDYDNMKTKVEETRAKAFSNERRINEMEDKQKWLERTTIGAFITAGVGIVIAFLRLALKI